MNFVNEVDQRVISKLLREEEKPSKDTVMADAEKSLTPSYGDGKMGVSQIRGWASGIVAQKSSTDTKRASIARQAEQILKNWDRSEEDAVKKFNAIDADSSNVRSSAQAVVSVKKNFAGQLSSLYKQWNV